MNIRLICDSGCDLSAREAEHLGITLLPLKTLFGSEEYLDGVTLSHEAFFEKLIETDVFPTTSQITPYEYKEAFRQAVEAGDTVICLTISSKLSGCWQSACLAAQDFPGQVYVVDTENVCVGERILAEYAHRLVDQAMTAEAIVQTLNDAKKKIVLVALLDTREYLKRGGRISPLVAAAGSLLAIKPVIAIQDGAVALLGKARGSRQGNNKLTEMIDQAGGIEFDMPYCLAYSGLSDHLLRKYMEDHAALYAGHTDHLPVSTIGCVIGTHVGPGAIAVAFFRR